MKIPLLVLLLLPFGPFALTSHAQEKSTATMPPAKSPGTTTSPGKAPAPGRKDSAADPEASGQGRISSKRHPEAGRKSPAPAEQDQGAKHPTRPEYLFM